jgi:hypothetical protein
MFWYFPPTSEPIIGSFRASLIYDLPVFLSYLSIIPGMAVFLVRIETDFVEYYNKFYDAVRGGGSLEFIENMRDEMVIRSSRGSAKSARSRPWRSSPPSSPARPCSTPSASPALPAAAPCAGHRRRAAGRPDGRAQRLLLSRPAAHRALPVHRVPAPQRAVHRRRCWLGAALYGYGFTLAVLLTLATGLVLLSRQLSRLEYETFMLQ